MDCLRVLERGLEKHSCGKHKNLIQLFSQCIVSRAAMRVGLGEKSKLGVIVNNALELEFIGL